MQKKLKPKNDTVIHIDSLTKDQYFELMGYEQVDQSEFNEEDGESIGIAYEFKNETNNN